MKFSTFLLVFWFIGTGHKLTSQEIFPFPSLSPKGTLCQIVGNTSIKIEYERPAARGRTIFGELVPWGKVWRTGAGYCTKITFDRTVKVNDVMVNSGTYSLFTIPNPDVWSVMLNRDTTLYGSASYNPSKNIARFEVESAKINRFYESLTIDLDVVPNNAKLYISWANTQVVFPIATTTDEEVVSFIQQDVMSGKKGTYDNYALAADYFYFQNENLELALLLADRAIATGKDKGWARTIKIDVYERMAAYTKAIDEIKIAIAETKKADYYQQEPYRLRDIEGLEARLDRMKFLLKKN